MRKHVWIGLLPLLALATVGGAAWACTAQPQVFGISPQTGPSGIQVTVSGKMQFAGAVQLRWNGQGIAEGLEPVEAQTDPNGSFSVKTVVPEASPGVYYLTFESVDRSIARASFEVTAQATGSSERTSGVPSAPVTGDLWSGLANSPARALSAEAAGSRPQTGPAIGPGIALAAAGFVALFAAAAVGVRRRRSLS